MFYKYGFFFIIYVRISASREASPIRASDRGVQYRHSENGYVNGHGHENSNGNYNQNGQITTDPSDDEYIDTVEVWKTIIK